jgi:hypothetical protein
MIRHGAAASFQQGGAVSTDWRTVDNVQPGLGRLAEAHPRKQPDFEGH